MRLQKIITAEEQQLVLSDAVEILRADGTVAFPTDTVYGLAASAFSFKGIARLYEMKKRDENKSIAVLLGDVSQAKLVAESFSSEAESLANKFWPGALTLIVEKKDGLPENISRRPTIGIRIPDHDFVRNLIRMTGPLAVTSANLSGKAPSVSIDGFLDELGAQLDLILDGGKTVGGIPSTVIDCTVAPLKILRQGSISAEKLGLSTL